MTVALLVPNITTKPASLTPLEQIAGFQPPTLRRLEARMVICSGRHFGRYPLGFPSVRVDGALGEAKLTRSTASYVSLTAIHHTPCDCGHSRRCSKTASNPARTLQHGETPTSLSDPTQDAHTADSIQTKFVEQLAHFELNLFVNTEILITIKIAS